MKKNTTAQISYHELIKLKLIMIMLVLRYNYYLTVITFGKDLNFQGFYLSR